ncbi:hypothetical protein FQZ97_654530 [compost metagenome]
MATAVTTATTAASTSSSALRQTCDSSPIGTMRTRQIAQAAGRTTTSTLKAMRPLNRSRASLGSVWNAFAIMLGSITTRYWSM